MAPKPKLNSDQIAEIVRLKRAQSDISNDALATRFGVSRNTITKALAVGAATEFAGLSSDLVGLELAQLRPSARNPRRQFVDESVVELANSIAASGLLQNLVVRPAYDNNANAFYEIIAGERRFRALTLLASENRWSDLIPCRVLSADDGDALALALLENLQREQITPLDEADAFVQLQALDILFTTDEIARRIGRTARYVQQRVAISLNLVAPAKSLLRCELITVEAARLLAAEPHATQLEILAADGLDDFDWPADYDLPDPVPTAAIRDGLKYIHRRAELERQAVAGVLGQGSDALAQETMRLDCQPIDQADSVDQADSAEQADSVDQADSSGVTKAHIYAAHRAKSLALQRRIGSDENGALMLACMAMLGPQDLILGITPADTSSAPCVDDRVAPHPKLVAKIKELLDVEPPRYIGDTAGVTACWNRLDVMPSEMLLELFTALIACKLYTPAGPNASLGDSPFAVTVADSITMLGIYDNDGLTLKSVDQLAGLSRAHLRALYRRLGIPGELAPNATKTQLLAGLATAINAGRGDSFVLPTYLFGTSAEIESWLA